jgi:hypothetical protein
MTREQEDRRLNLVGYIGSIFPEGYWKNFENEFGHSFLNVHLNRTLEYDMVLGEKISHKKVLEVGGFPGLEAAWLLHRQPESIDIIDSPLYVPDFYWNWIYSIDADIHVHVHDITSGEPDIGGGFDVAIMSDVLLHIDGFPMKFMVWLAGAADEIHLINYKGDAKISNAKGHNLRAGHNSIPSNEEMIAFMESAGAKHIETIPIIDGDRQLISFKGK